MITVNELAQLLGGVPYSGEENPTLSSLSATSSECTPQSVFVAVRGVSQDGHQFVNDAYQQGASCCVVEDATVLQGRVGIVVPNTREALSTLAALFAGKPSEKLLCVGVTGTNGKSTSVQVISSLLTELGTRSFSLGTLGARSKDEVFFPETLTTPGPVDLHAILREGVQRGYQGVALEVSSHALHQSRASALSLDGAVFTNFTQDHLDYHGTMEEYLQAKLKIFSLLVQSTKPKKTAVVNYGIPQFSEIAAHASALGIPLLSFGWKEGASLQLSAMELQEYGTVLSLHKEGKQFRLKIPYLGAHNVENVAGALLVCEGLGMDFSELVRKSEFLSQVPGRLERHDTKGRAVFIDYAHTPDALHRVLTTLRPLAALRKGSLTVLFGCGGDRDKKKRPLMAQVAEQYADKVVVTSDNPRTEDPEEIIRDICAGFVAKHLTITDRREAIAEVLSKRTAPGEVVLIAGKGHEEYQIIGKQKHHFSDREEVQRVV